MGLLKIYYRTVLHFSEFYTCWFSWYTNAGNSNARYSNLSVLPDLLSGLVTCMDYTLSYTPVILVAQRAARQSKNYQLE